MKMIPAATALFISILACLKAGDRVLEDFEGPDYGSWFVEGEAFAPGPQAPLTLYQNREGNQLAMSRREYGGDGAVGTLTSPPFVIDRRYLHFLIGGGNHPGETCVELLVDGRVVKSSPGPSSRVLQPVVWDLREMQGRIAQIRLADRRTGQWGHIAADYFVLSNSMDPPPTFGKAPDAHGDIILADFEAETFAPWITHGAAFAAGPYRPVDGDGFNITGFEGERIAKSNPASSSDGMGSLISPSFQISRPYLNFLVGGGDQAFRTAISLWIDGRIVRTSSGNGTNQLEWRSWDLHPYQGLNAVLGIHDLTMGDEPMRYILVDQIHLSHDPKAPHSGSVDEAIAQVKLDAVNAIRRNQQKAASDPYRPIYHYTPPAQRMNDPNGPGWFNGHHHLFYQHMVFIEHGSATNVHWGHARSTDLVNWETLLLAIRPLYEHGEISVFSGNLAWDKNGNPAQFTTMVPYLPGIFRRIWMARPLDDDWIRWEREPVSPEGLLPVGDENRNIKDPFPFSAGARRFLVLTDRTIPIYEAVDNELTQWVFRSHLDPESAECPNFFEVGEKWIYLASPHAPVRYRIGDFDPGTAKFSPRREGYINHDTRFYASTLYQDDQGQTILLGITRGQRSGEGWTGALAMPRILSIGPHLRPRMFPPPALEQLRYDPFAITEPIFLNHRTVVIEGLEGDAMEIMAQFRLNDADAFGLEVRRSADGSRFIPIMWENGRIVVQRELEDYVCHYSIDPETRELTFRIFLDKGILDVCTMDGLVFESRIHYEPLENLGVAVFAKGGSAELLSLEAWQMRAAVIDHTRLLESR